MRSGAAKFSLPVILAFLAVAVPGSPARQDMSVIVQTPPMGWNSWDAWGYTGSTNRSSATPSPGFTTTCSRFSWQYVVIDEGWFAQHPENPAGHQDYTLCDDGRYCPPSTASLPPPAAKASGRCRTGCISSASSSASTSCAASRVKPSVEPAHRGSHFTPPTPPTPPIPARGTRQLWRPQQQSGQACYDSLADLYAKWGVDSSKSTASPVPGTATRSP